MGKRFAPELRNGLQETSAARRDRICRWTAALLIAALCYVICKTFGIMSYHTNDDTSIQDFLSGQYTGTPLASHSYIHIFLSWFVSRLYVLVPGVEWWYLGSQVLMVGGMVLINYALLSPAGENKYNFGLSAVLAGLTDACLLCWPLSRSSYTMVSGIVGTAGICLLLSFTEGKKGIAARAVSYGLFVLAFCIRSSVGYVAACFYMLAVFILCIRSPGKWLRKAGILFMAALVLMGTAAGLSAVNSHFQREIDGADYLAFNRARSAYIDYPHDSYDENPAIYGDVGWTRETAWLVNQWCFMDERVTTENLRYLVENSRKERESLRPGTLWKRFSDQQKREMVRPTEWFWLMTALAALLAILAGKQKRLLAGFGLNVIGCAALVLYQLYGGRILYRTFYICALPSAVINLVLGAECLEHIKWKKAGAVLACLLVLFGCFAAGSTARILFGRRAVSKAVSQQSREDTLGEYVLSHPENIYIEDTQTVDNLFPYSPRPVNLVEWGKPDFHSKAQRLKLEANGIGELTGEVMKRENVFFISDVNLADRESSGEALSASCRMLHFYRWLKQEYAAAGIRQEDRMDGGLFVYQFVFDGGSPGGDCYDIREDGTVSAAGGEGTE